MMILFPVLRKFMNSLKIMYTSFAMSFLGYVVLLLISISNASNVMLLLIPAFLIMSALGMMNVCLTIFLANTCDYGELKNGRRDESVVFSMQTFVVKLSSGLAALFASLILQFTKISELSKLEEIVLASDASRTGLRFSMTLIPMVLMVVAIILFKRRYVLTDEKMEEIQRDLAAKKA